MRTLFFLPLCPFSRKVRIALAERKLDYQPIIENVWKQREEFLEINPTSQVPVLVDLDKQIICDSTVICEYIDEMYSETSFIGEEVLQRAETRRIAAFFDGKFNQEVTHKLVFEKIFKRHFGWGGPDSRIIREGNTALHQHLDYLSWLIDRRHWLAGDDFSLADIAGAAHLSCLDYVGHLSWEKYPEIKEWYGRIKCRPSMRPLLFDQAAGITPPSHYKDLDF